MVTQAPKNKIVSLFNHYRRQAMYALVLAMLIVPMAAAQAQTAAPALTFEIDTTPLFNSINTYIPVFFALLSVAGGIMIAMIIVRYIINAIKSAFEGRDI